MGWMIVLFDLPVKLDTDRKAATKFRDNLLNRGYMMMQFSVYARCAVTLDKKDTLLNELKEITPPRGSVQCIFITDNQWGDSIVLRAPDKKSKRSISNDVEYEQLMLW